MFNVLVTDAYTIESLNWLKSEISCEIFKSENPSPTEVELANIDGLLVRSRTRIHQGLPITNKLKVICSATSGFDHIDISFCQNKKIITTYAPGAHAQSVAEHTIQMLLQLVKHPSLSGTMKWRVPSLRGYALKGKTLGLIGLGRVGSRVAEISSVLGLKVIAYDPYNGDEVFSELQVERAGISELLRMADIVSLHAPLTEETKALINRETLSIMHPDSFLINTSRGKIVKETDLISSLENGHIKGAALDVFENEPLTEHSPLRKLKNVILTPHIAAFTREAWQASSRAAVEAMAMALSGKTPPDTLPPNALWYGK